MTKFEFNKKVNGQQLYAELQAAGFSVKFMNIEKDNSITIDATQDPVTIVNAHVPKVQKTEAEKIDSIQNLVDVKKYLKGEM